MLFEERFWVMECCEWELLFGDFECEWMLWVDDGFGECFGRGGMESVCEGSWRSGCVDWFDEFGVNVLGSCVVLWECLDVDLKFDCCWDREFSFKVCVFFEIGFGW